MWAAYVKVLHYAYATLCKTEREGNIRCLTMVTFCPQFDWVRGQSGVKMREKQGRGCRYAQSQTFNRFMLFVFAALQQKFPHGLLSGKEGEFKKKTKTWQSKE